MNRKIAVTPAMAYSISPPLKAVRRLGEAPHKSKEGYQDSDVKKIQHDSPHNGQQHHFMSCLCQSARKFLFPRWPPPLLCGEDHK